MKFEELHPRDQLVGIMQQIYDSGMTTLSGGNLSILDDVGDIWITPAAIDKGKLTPEDVVCVRADGTMTGRHRPSSELPFHRAIYAARPDFRAIAHAHPPALVAFSIAHATPDTRILPRLSRLCGTVGYAPYALTGSEALGINIAQTFAAGHDVVLLENHGVVAGGRTLRSAFRRMESLETAARTQISAQGLGDVFKLTDEQLALASLQGNPLALDEDMDTSAQADVRKQIVDMARRACARKLMTSAEGVISARTGNTDFIITPADKDLRDIEPDDLVLVRDGRCDSDGMPGVLWPLHASIYAKQPDIQAIMIAQPPGVTAFAITGNDFDTRTIPESYIMLRSMPLIEFGPQYSAPDSLAGLVSSSQPVVLMQNEGILTTGKNLLEAFDRLEVAEFSAGSLIDAAKIGQMVPIEDEQIEEMKIAFNLS